MNRITFRADDALIKKLTDEAGKYGNISNVVRVILESFFLRRGKR